MSHEQTQVITHVPTAEELNLIMSIPSAQTGEMGLGSLQREMPSFAEPLADIATRRGHISKLVGRVTGRLNIPKAVNEVVANETVVPYETQPEEYAYGEADTGSVVGLIERFRKDVVWNPDVTRTLKNAYGVVRNIGDDLLISQDKSGEVAKLLSHTRTESRPVNFVGIEGDDDTLAVHGEVIRKMGIHDKNLQVDAHNLAGNMKKQGVELKQPSDALLFAAINTTAHESGHAILAGVSKLIISTSGRENPMNRLEGDDRIVATKTYLAAHPEEAVTGNWPTDTITQEERFAEGFGNAVLGKVIDTLGYTQDEKMKVIDYFLNKAGLRDALIGEHPIDMLDKFSSQKGIIEVSQDAGVDFSVGTIGYSMPLSLERMANELAVLAKLIKNGASTGYVTAVEGIQWEQSVHSHQSARTKAEIYAQRALRHTWSA
jgi:hypothetical protein